EVELAAARLRRVRKRPPVLDVRAEPDGLFGDIRSVCEAHDLLRNDRLLDARVGLQLANLVREPRTERGRPGRSRVGGPFDALRKLRPSPIELGAQVLPLTRAHAIELLDGVRERPF